jgi:hypothetical protein
MQVRERMRRGYSAADLFSEANEFGVRTCWLWVRTLIRHCEGQSPEAIRGIALLALDCFAALAMTKRVEVSPHNASIRPIVS